MERQKIILYSNQLDLNQPIVLTFSLTADNNLTGSYTIFNDDKTIREVKTDNIVSGATSSKLIQLVPTFSGNNYLTLINLLNKDILLSDGREYGRITNITAYNIEYSLNIYSDTPIKYVDFSNETSIFYYNRKSDNRDVDPPHFIAYEGIQEEPKILSDIFIERGVVSGFDNLKRLKQIKSLQELIKYGDGYFNVTTKARDITTR